MMKLKENKFALLTNETIIIIQHKHEKKRMLKKRNVIYGYRTHYIRGDELTSSPPGHKLPVMKL